MSSLYKYKDVPIDSFLQLTSPTSSGFNETTTVYTANQSITNIDNKSIEESYPCGYTTTTGGDLVGLAVFADHTSTDEATYETTVAEELHCVGVGGAGGAGGHGGQGNDDGPGKGSNGKATNGGWGHRGAYGEWAHTTYPTDSSYKYIKVKDTFGNGGGTGNTGGKRNNGYAQFRTGYPGNVGGTGTASTVQVRYSNDNISYTGYTTIFTAGGGTGGNGGPGGGNTSNYGPYGDSTTYTNSGTYTNIERNSSLTGINSTDYDITFKGNIRGKGGFQGYSGNVGLCRTYVLKK